MSQKEVNHLNRVFRRVVISIAALMAVFAIIYNPGHLVTASIIYIFGAEAEFVKSDKFDLR
jgi:hypothetical protein